MEVNLPGKFSSLEEDILCYLFDRPDGNVGTVELVGLLKSAQGTAEQRERSIQYGIESLVAAGLVRGKRISKSGRVQYAQLRLTAKGDPEAIRQKRRLKSVNVNILMLGDEEPTTTNDK